jgi:uncharacterized protein YycO
MDKKHLELGDILLSANHRILSRIIREVNKSPVSHASIYVGRGMVVESIAQYPSRIVCTSIRDAMEYLDYISVHRFQSLAKVQADMIVSFCIDRVGTPYDYLGAILASFGICRENPKKWYCSELIIDAFEGAGINLIEDEQCKSINALRNSRFLKEVGVLQNKYEVPR